MTILKITNESVNYGWTSISSINRISYNKKIYSVNSLAEYEDLHKKLLEQHQSEFLKFEKKLPSKQENPLHLELLSNTTIDKLEESYFSDGRQFKWILYLISTGVGLVLVEKDYTIYICNDSGKTFDRV